MHFLDKQLDLSVMHASIFLQRPKNKTPTDELGGDRIQDSDIKKLKKLYQCCYTQDVHVYGDYKPCKGWAKEGWCVNNDGSENKWTRENCSKSCGGKCWYY